MTRLILAVCPSNQDGNKVLGGGTEMEHIATLAAAVLHATQGHPSIISMMFTGEPESTDFPPGSLHALTAQQWAARDWIVTARQPGDLTVSLNLHSDSGRYRHCGYYWDSLAGRGEGEWLGRAMAESVKGWFGGKVLSADYGTVPVGNGQFGYLFARELRAVACPVLLEMGSHQMLEDVAAVRDHAGEIAAALVGRLISFFGLETADPPLNLSELRTFGEWALARCSAGEDPRIRGDFEAHLQALGCDTSDLSRWGWPA